MYPYHSPKLKHVVFIGDAAHAMSPVLGQGVNLALNDALLLSETIQQHNGKLGTALEEYSAKRRWKMFYYQSLSRWLNPWYSLLYSSIYINRFQSSYIPGFALTRDLFFAPVSTSSDILKREMLLTMAGAKNKSRVKAKPGIYEL